MLKLRFWVIKLKNHLFWEEFGFYGLLFTLQGLGFFPNNIYLTCNNICHYIFVVWILLAVMIRLVSIWLENLSMGCKIWFNMYDSIIKYILFFLLWFILYCQYLWESLVVKLWTKVLLPKFKSWLCYLIAMRP